MLARLGAREAGVLSIRNGRCSLLLNQSNIPAGPRAVRLHVDTPVTLSAKGRESARAAGQYSATTGLNATQ